MKAEIKIVTPTMARDWLKTSSFNNRNLRTPNVAKIARDITGGKWVFDGNPIRFDNEGNIIDGQHRLSAIIAADKSVQTLVVVGLDSSAKNTIDTGSARTTSDVLHFNGYKQTSRLAAVCRLHLGYQKHDGDLLAWARTTQHRGSSVQELLEIAEENPRLQDCCSIDKKYKSANALLSPAALNYSFYLIGNLQGGAIFFEQLNSGASLADGNPILALRNSLLNKRGTNHGTRDIVYSIAMVIKSWNLYKKEKKAYRIIYKPDHEPYPMIAQA